MEIKSNNRIIEIDKLPDTCPFCHQIIAPTLKGVNLNTSECYISELLLSVELFLICSNKNCQKSFIGYFERVGNNEFNFSHNLIGTPKNITFPPAIISISPKFSIIYNQAYIAEQYNLPEICGMGYRKALEFLLKDYSINRNPEKKEQIEKVQLQELIKLYLLDDQNIREIAERAAWLGNDESHYIKKHDNCSLIDLKELIGAIVSSIDLKFKHEKYLNKIRKK